MANDPDQLEQRLAAIERRLKQLEYGLRTTDAHVAAVENSILFRALRRAGRPILDAKTLAAGWIARLPFQRRRSRPDRAYAAWTARRTAEPLPPLAATPSFAILVENSGEHSRRLEETVASLRSQTYGCWELFVSCAPSGDRTSAGFPGSLERSDRRIHCRWSGEGGPAGALNGAAAESRADYLIVLRDGDVLACDALHRLAAGHPADIIYSDEDCIDGDGRPVSPLFKPDWSPDLLLSCMYLGRMMAVSRAAWERAGGLHPEYGGAQEYDLALRITERAAVVRHQPYLLCHTRDSCQLENGTARRAVEDSLRRRGASAVVEDGVRPGGHQIRWLPASGTSASIVVCSRSARLLDQCLSSIASRTGYPHREIVVVQHLGTEDFRLQEVIERHGARRIPYAGEFHFSRMNNLGARAATGDVLVFLNDDTEPLDDSWLERLIGQVARPDVGAAGGLLLYPSGTVQHAGISMGIGDGCGHIGRGAVEAAYWPWLQMTRDVSAVTGALLGIRAGLFREIGGFADEFPSNYNDTDLCLRLRAAGYRVVCDAAVRLRHYEAQTRQTRVTLSEREEWYARWSHVMDRGDPFYSPHLTRDREDLSLRP